MERLDVKVALVTGASRGYGRAIAERLARDGAFVVVHHATNADAANKTVTAIQSAGGAAISLAAPLDGSPAGVEALFVHLDREMMTERGTTTVDILVNNAAISPRGKPESFASASVYSAFKRVADVTDIADIVAFLASHDARWITGQLIDGGGGSGI